MQSKVSTVLNCRLRCGVYNDRVDIGEGWRANGEEGTGQLCITQVRRHRLLKLDSVAMATVHLLCAACLMAASLVSTMEDSLTR